MVELTPDQMVTVKAFAPFELAEIFTAWAEHQAAFEDGACMEGRWAHLLADLGPPWRQVERFDPPAHPGGRGTFTWKETTEEFGRRMAAGIITLLKEV